jgi:hypothetical protein
MNEARTIFDQQRDFALRHRVREPGLHASKLGLQFAAWRDIEYGLPVTIEMIDDAWRDVELALRNLFHMDEIRALLRGASYRVSQRRLHFDLDGIKVRAVPDVIALFTSQPPLIIDWKVNAVGIRDYRLQLALYALTLTRCEPHSDFSTYLDGVPPNQVRLTEAQLLTGEARSYILDQADLDEAEDYVVQTAAEMSLALGDESDGAPRPDDFEATRFASTCQRCAFKKMCWEEVQNGMARNQYLPDHESR